jgi:hypothetical protein
VTTYEEGWPQKVVSPVVETLLISCFAHIIPPNTCSSYLLDIQQQVPITAALTKPLVVLGCTPAYSHVMHIKTIAKVTKYFRILPLEMHSYRPVSKKLSTCSFSSCPCPLGLRSNRIDPGYIRFDDFESNLV